MKYHVFFFGGRSEARAASGTIRLEKAILLSPEFCHHLQTVPFVIIITIFIIIIVIIKGMVIITIIGTLYRHSLFHHHFLPECCQLQSVTFAIASIVNVMIDVNSIIINVIFIILITFCQKAASCKVSHLSYSNAHSSDV